MLAKGKEGTKIAHGALRLHIPIVVDVVSTRVVQLQFFPFSLVEFIIETGTDPRRLSGCSQNS